MSASKEGWLVKQGSSFLKTWSKRWFFLRGSSLVYTEKPGRKELGIIKVGEATEICMAPECKRQPAFKIVVPSQRTYYLEADSIGNCREWIASLQPVKGSDIRYPQRRLGKTRGEKVTIDDFEVLKVLGKGGYGKVYLVRYKSNGQLYAMKSMSKKHIEDCQQIEEVLLEKEILLRNRNPFLVGAYFSFQTPTQLFLIFDYVPGGELSERIIEEERFKQDRVVLYAAEMVSALGYLHQKGIVYRDLKAENILIDRNGHLKLSDFGLCKSNMIDNTTTTFCGTEEYMAPEVINRQPYDKSVDWWSLGVLIFEMLVGYTPFYDENTSKMYRLITTGELQFPAFVTPQARELITRLLDKNPKTRLGSGDSDAEEIRQMSFFSSIDWKSLNDRKITPQWIPTIYDDADTSNFNRYQNDKAMLLNENPAVGLSYSDFFKNFSSGGESILDNL